jgi:hypothetical protein
MKTLPHAQIEKAYMAPGAEEFAWRRVDIPEVLQAIASSGQAVLGGEAWIIKDKNENWVGLVPGRNGDPDGVWHWETSPKKEKESWQSYCERTRVESLDVLQNINVEDETRADVVPHLWFNTCFVEPYEHV